VATRRRRAAVRGGGQQSSGDVGHEGANERHGTLPHPHAKLRAAASSTDSRRRGGAARIMRPAALPSSARVWGKELGAGRGGAFIGRGCAYLECGPSLARGGAAGSDSSSGPARSARRQG
jgi:hypothetical protein